MIDRKPREGYGYGVIQLSRHLTEYIAPLAQLNATDLQGELMNRGVFDSLKKGLYLPDDYTIIAVFVKPYQFIWTVLVEAPGIPIPDEGEMLPLVTPVYQQERDELTGKYNKMSLVRMDILENDSCVLRID